MDFSDTGPTVTYSTNNTLSEYKYIFSCDSHDARFMT